MMDGRSSDLGLGEERGKARASLDLLPNGPKSQTHNVGITSCDGDVCVSARVSHECVVSDRDSEARADGAMCLLILVCTHNMGFPLYCYNFPASTTLCCPSWPLTSSPPPTP